MAPIEWRDEFSVGVAAVDHEHRELIDLVNALQRRLAEGAGVEAAFGDLLRGISAHFALEERFMREHRYDGLDAHKADHERLLDELREIMDGYEADRDGSAERLSTGVEAWFVTHFKTHDARLHSRLGAHPH